MLCEQRRRSGLNVSYQKPATESYRSSEDRGTLTSKIRNDHSKANSDFIEKKGPPSTQPEPVIVIDDGDDDDDETQTSQKSTLNTQTAAFRKGEEIFFFFSLILRNEIFYKIKLPVFLRNNLENESVHFTLQNWNLKCHIDHL